MKTYTEAEIVEIINQNREEKNEGELYVSDNSFKPFSAFDRLKLFFITKITTLKPYKSEIRDCDDFADITKGRVADFMPGRAFGTIWAENLPNVNGYHALNFYIDQNKEMWIYEPQNGKRYQTKLSGKRTLIII
jgi:hypothetical protein